MKRSEKITPILAILLTITSFGGILSMGFDKSYIFVNQYGQKVQMFGYGLYSHDTYFHAPIAIGTDWCILILLVPLLLVQYYKSKNEDRHLQLFSLYGVALYYAISITFGNAYNRLELVYIALFGLSTFGMCFHFSKLSLTKIAIQKSDSEYFFLIMAGIALIVAWLPDIIPTVITGEPLKLIGTYTTEVTYALDMGILSPLCFLTVWFLKKGSVLGNIFADFLLQICTIVGAMVIMQSVFQWISKEDIPLAAIITKAVIFVVLGGIGAILLKTRREGRYIYDSTAHNSNKSIPRKGHHLF